jgi:CRP/FNR family transcriptional regulator, cyclic AMP receptor protein
MAPERRPGNRSEAQRFLTGRGPGQTRLQFAPGCIVCSQGDTSDALYYIEQGWIKMSVSRPNGKEAVISLRGAGEFFSTRCLIERHHRIATVMTLTECVLVRIAVAAVRRLIRGEPDFAEFFSTYLVGQGRRDQLRLVDQLTDDSERRLARALLRLAGDDLGDRPQPISARLSQTDLASMIGTTRSRISHFMNKFRRLGYISYDRHGLVTVHKSLARTLNP